MQPIPPRRAAHCVLATLAWAGGAGLLARWLADILNSGSSPLFPWGGASLALGGVFWLIAGSQHFRAGRCLAEGETIPILCAAFALGGHFCLLTGVAVLFVHAETGRGFVGSLAWLSPVVLAISPLSIVTLLWDGFAASRSRRLFEGSLQMQSTLLKLSLLTALLGAACCGALLLNERMPRSSGSAWPTTSDAVRAAPSAAPAP